MVLYRLTLAPLTEELKDADPTLLSPFYTDDAAHRSARQSVAQLRLLMDQRTDWGYFPKTDKYLFISYNPEEKETVKRELEQVGLNIDYVDGGRYLGAYWGPREDIQEWM